MKIERHWIALFSLALLYISRMVKILFKGNLRCKCCHHLFHLRWKGRQILRRVLSLVGSSTETAIFFSMYVSCFSVLTSIESESSFFCYMPASWYSFKHPASTTHSTQLLDKSSVRRQVRLILLILPPSNSSFLPRVGLAPDKLSTVRTRQ